TMPEWIQLIGSAWVYVRPGQPPISYHPIPPYSLEVTVEDRGHPIMAGVPSSFFLAKDELWQNLREAPNGGTGGVLASARDERTVDGQIQVTTGPVAYALQRGQGRVFNTHLGHSPSTFRNPDFQKIMVQSAEWVAGLR